MKFLEKNINLFIVLTGLILFIPFIGSVHLFDWDEINFAESAREMIMTKNYLTVQINFIPFWEKPPMFIWMQVLSMKIFGINEFAARFPNVIAGIATLLAFFNIGKKLVDKKFGVIWVMVYVGSILPFLYFKSGIIDPWFNLFIFLGIHQFILFVDGTDKNKRIILSALFIGLGILTKGPVALLIFLLSGLVYLLIHKFRLKISFVQVLLYTAVLSFVGGFWFILQIVSGNFDIIKDFIAYQIELFNTEGAGHGRFLLYHFVVLLIGVFPISVFGLKYMVSKDKNSNETQALYLHWMKILFWVVLILFTIVKTKIVHYSSMCYFPLSFVGARYVYNWIQKKEKPGIFLKVLLAIIGGVYVLFSILIPFIMRYKNKLFTPDNIKDPFALGNIQANVYWSGWEGIVAFTLLVGLLLFFIYNKKNISKAIGSLFIATSAFVFLFTVVYVPKIEGYSQRAAIEFYESKINEKCYITPLGFKSYAHLFYTKKHPVINKKSFDKNWLLQGKIDEPAYFVTKINKKDSQLKLYPTLKVLYEQNGYVFLYRFPEK